MATSEARFAIVLTTVPGDDEGAAIGRALVDRRLAACVSVVPGVRSFYRWQGAVHEDAERLLVIKTRAAQFEELRRAVRELHSYDTPEIILLEISDGDPAYLAWLASETSARGTGSESA